MICGIDPGLTGGIAILDGKSLFRRPMPLAGGLIDIQQISDLFTEHSGDLEHVFFEDVHALFNSSAGATFSFGHGVGLIEGCLVAKRVPYTKVAPKAWQKEMFQGVPMVTKTVKGKKKVDCKAMALVAAKRLFPMDSFLATERSTKPHEGMIDAALIASYGQRKLK
jgi:hypothetical protein